MAIFKRTYKTKDGKLKKSRIYWYHFIFSGQHVQESTRKEK